VVIEQFGRRVVGRSIDPHIKTGLATRMARLRRPPGNGPLSC
jgi:hypothetical protein